MDLEVLARRLQALHAGFVNQVEERRRAAVHDRHLGRVQLDDDVVDADADERGEQMFDGVDVDRVARETGGELDAADVFDCGRNLEAAEIGAPETNAGVSRCGLERQRDLVAGMETDACAGDGSAKCPL